MANAVTWFVSHERRLIPFPGHPRCRTSQEITCLFVRLQQGFDSVAEISISLASLAQITIALLRRKAHSFREDGNIGVRSTVHFVNRALCHLSVEYNLRWYPFDALACLIYHDSQHGSCMIR